MEKCYFNGGCLTCRFADRDNRNRYEGPCSGYAHCDYEEYTGPEPEMYEEDKDNYIKLLEKLVRNSLGEGLAESVLRELREKAVQGDLQ